MKKILFVFVITVIFSCTNKAQVKHYNNFDTFTLTPFDSKNKTNLKVECYYKNEKLTKIDFISLNGEKLVSSDIIYFNEQSFFVSKYKNYDDYILLSYVKDGKVMNMRFINKRGYIETQGFYFLNSKYEKDWRNYNFKILSKNYLSVMEFLKKDLNRLVISEDFDLTENFKYIDNVFFEYSFTKYFSKKKDGTYNLGYPASREKIHSFAGCFFLDSILYESNYFTDALLMDNTK